MFFLEFLKRPVPADDVVTREFIELMVPQLLEKYVDSSAKGGTHQDDDTLAEKTKRDFEAKGDQSMFSHLLNGIFPSLRLMHVLKDEGGEKFSDLERRVYILSYLMHDIDKIKRCDVETKTREAIEESKAFIAEELRDCNAEAFFPRDHGVSGRYHFSGGKYAAHMEDAFSDTSLEASFVGSNC